ncbi:MAG: T9SS type A sorting domain-containing protein [Candidatus Latescibacterota bacterium]
MKKCLILGVILLFAASSVFAANFAPTQLKLTAPASVQYNFDGKTLSIPVTVTGTPASVTFTVFTKDQAAKIVKVKNGYLGWHYVNKIDTCVFVSKPLNMGKGSNTITWDGKSETGAALPDAVYTYYLWGYDNVSPKVRATKWIQTYAHNLYLRFQEKDTEGKPLAAPIVYHHGSRNNAGTSGYYGIKWTLGGDPMDSTLVQTTHVAYPGSYGKGMASTFHPKDFNNFFVELGHADTKSLGIAKYQWVPNGKAILDTKWGKEGISMTTANWYGGNNETGVETDGTYLYTAIGSHYNALPEAFCWVWDLDGEIVLKADIGDYFTNVEDSKTEGQMNGGPNTIYNRNGTVLLSSHASCMKVAVNGARGLEGEDDFFLWANGNGDYVLDHNFNADAKHKWMCNDYNVGPYTYTLNADANQFSLAPSYDMGAVSFGLLAPDGTGIGYMAFAGETAGLKYGQYLVDNGAAFDGLYMDNNNDAVAANKGGLWYIGSDSFKGIISKQVAVGDEAPAAFAVAQNVPNPFNPATTISFTLTRAGKTTVEVFNAAGQKVDTILNASLSAGSHSVTWNAARHSAGVYFYTVRNGDFSRTMKMTLLK